VSDDGRVWTPERRGLALGLVLTITMLAFEALGVSTAMPVVAGDLDGVELYGWTFSATLLGSIIGIALTGARVDRHGPGPPFVAGLALFTLGVVGAGSAPSMLILVACRFVQGVGVGAVPAVVYASIGRAFGERARARMFVLLSSAWVVPGLIGPAISGFVAEEIGWRWVFFGILPLVPVNAMLAAPPLFRLGPPARSDDDRADTARGTVPMAVLLAGSAALVLTGLNAGTLASAPLVIAGAAGAYLPLRRLLPAGTFAARPGLPAAIATRGMATLAFFTGQYFLPLTLTDLRGQRAAFAGLALTFSTLTWTAGAWLQDKRGHVWGRRSMVVWGVALVLVGVSATATVIAPGVPVAVAAITWSVAGLGMGMGYGGLSLLVLAEAPTGQEGRASSAMQLAEQVTVAAGTGFAGAAVAAADRGGELRPGLIVAYALAIGGAALGAIASLRLRSASTESEELVAPFLGLVPDAFDD
jgi:MFS family permease